MDIPYLRSEFLLAKTFLHLLYANNPRKNTAQIANATEKQLNILIKICHLIANGRISIRSSDFTALQNSKRHKLFHNQFYKRDNFLSLLKSSKQIKINELKKFTAVYRHLLYTMFNKE